MHDMTLNDRLGQYLSCVKMSLEAVSGADANSKEGVSAATLESVERCISETRTLSSLLHPPLLDEVGLSLQPAGTPMNLRNEAESKWNWTCHRR